VLTQRGVGAGLRFGMLAWPRVPRAARRAAGRHAASFLACLPSTDLPLARP
jgi:hypothetical protein